MNNKILKIDKLDFRKIKNFSVGKDIINKVKNNQPIKWKKIFLNNICGNDLVSKTYRKLLEPQNKKDKYQTQNWARDSSRCLSKIHEKVFKVASH
jgi:hypothetical protein